MPSQRRRPFWHLGRSADRVRAEIDEEIGFHLERRIEELRARGLPAAEARRQALRQFGDLEATRDYCRRQDRAADTQVRRSLRLDDMRQDLRISVRSLLRTPVLALTIVMTVGLGIGATTVIASAVYSALLRPLPYAGPDQLVRIYTDAPPNRFRLSVADYLALTAQQTRFSQIAGYTDGEMTFSDGTVAERVRGRLVSWSYFGLLGIRPAAGRDFVEADGRPGAAPAVVVSHGFWQRRLSGRPDAVGRYVRLDGIDHLVAGILPPLSGPLEQRQEYFVAARWDTPPRKGPFFITAIGRLRNAGDSVTAAEELRAINRRMFPLWRASYQDETATWGLMDLRRHVTGDVGRLAGLAIAAVGLVWLIACVNASNLLVARVTSRGRELAVRTALGASRARIVRHLMAESVVLAAASALSGIAIAWAGILAIRRFGVGFIPRTQEIGFDDPAWWVLIALTVMSAVLFGAIPALHGGTGRVDESLRATSRSSTGTVRVQRLRRLLVASQFAIATPLLVVSGLLLASLYQLSQVNLGFDSHGLLSGSLLLPTAQYPEPEKVGAFWDELRTRVEALPGVADVAFADGRPPNDVDNFNNFELEALPTAPGQSPPVTPWVAVTHDYFPLLGLTLLEGRLFDERDGRGPALEAVVVDRAWAARFFPGQSALGKRFREGGCTDCPWTSVVGVVSDVKYAGLDQPDAGTVYTPIAGRGFSSPIEQATSRFRYLIVRTSLAAEALLPSIRQVVRGLDPNLPLSDVATVDDLVGRSLEGPRSLSMLVFGFAAVALLLSIVGIYGVMTYYVQQHARDIGIRLALGGSREEVLRLVVGQGMRVVVAGIALGLIAAYALAQWISSLLFGVAAGDALTFAAVTIALLAAALVACLVPAKRAMGVQPAVVLRNE